MKILIRIIFTICFTFSLSVNGRLLTKEELINKKLNAVYKITVSWENEGVLGTAFAVSNDGVLITARHNIKYFYEHQEKVTKISVFDYAGNYYKDVWIEDCSDFNQVDLCTLKINPKTKIEYFKINEDPKSGQPVIGIGHCGEKFNVMEGKIIGSTSNVHGLENMRKGYSFNRNALLYQTNLDQCVGDSGGPLFDSFGELIGSFSFFTKSSMKKYSVSSKEVKKYLNKDIKRRKLTNKELEQRFIEKYYPGKLNQVNKQKALDAVNKFKKFLKETN